MTCTSCSSFLKTLLYDYNLNWSKIVVCCYRRDVTVQAGLVCVEGCGVGSVY